MPSVSPKQEALTVSSGSKLLFRYGGQRPPNTMYATAYTLHKKRYPVWTSPRSLKVHGSGVKRTISAELPPGEYNVEVFVKEPRGDAGYFFRIIVDLRGL